MKCDLHESVISWQYAGSWHSHMSGLTNMNKDCSTTGCLRVSDFRRRYIIRSFTLPILGSFLWGKVSADVVGTDGLATESADRKAWEQSKCPGWIGGNVLVAGFRRRDVWGNATWLSFSGRVDWINCDTRAQRSLKTSADVCWNFYFHHSMRNNGIRDETYSLCSCIRGVSNCSQET